MTQKSKKNTKKLFIVVIVVLAVIALGMLYLKRVQPDAKVQKVPAKSFQSKLTDSEYKNVLNELHDLITNQNPRAALTKVKKDMEENPSVSASCHELLHDIGRLSYQKYGNFAQALQYKDEICVSGYTHGVIESYFTEKGHTIEEELPTLCSSSDENSYDRWECVHGIGHGLMYYSSNDLPKSIEGCNKLSEASDKSACANGAFMENFNADDVLHRSKYVNASNLFKACVLFPEYAWDCYMNAPIYYLNKHPYDFEGLFALCDTAPAEFKYSCYYGAGSQITRRYGNDPKQVEQLCMSQENVHANACISGMSIWYVSYYYSSEKANAICKELEESNMQVCQKSVSQVRLF